MDSFYFCLALGPFALYLVVLGCINLAPRPLLVTGGRETAALGLALAGLVIGGPMQLFFPEHAAARFGPLVWVLLVAFYTMGLTLLVLVSRPRLVIYNLSAAELRPILSDVAAKIDSTAAWAGDSLVLGELDVRLHIEELSSMRNVSLVSTGEQQSQRGWQTLERALRGQLRQTEVPRNSRGLSMISCGLVLLAFMAYQAMQDPQAIAQGLREMLRF